MTTRSMITFTERVKSKPEISNKFHVKIKLLLILLMIRTFGHIESVAKRELKGMKEFYSNDSEDEDDDSDSSVHAEDTVGCTSRRRLVSGSPSCGFPLKTRTALGGHNNICVSSAAIAAAAASNLIPEDLFDVMNVSDGLVAAIGEEDVEEDNEEEVRLLLL